MSSTYSKNKKELSGVKVVPSKYVRKEKKGKFSLRKDVDIVGKVELPLSGFIIKANNKKSPQDSPLGALPYVLHRR